MKKSWYSSKTLWVAVGTFLTTVAAQVIADPETVKVINEVVATGLPLLMVGLRAITKEPIA